MFLNIKKSSLQITYKQKTKNIFNVFLHLKRKIDESEFIIKVLYILKGLFQSIYFVEHFIIIHRLTKIMKPSKTNIKWVLKCKSHHLKILCLKEIKLDLKKKKFFYLVRIAFTSMIFVVGPKIYARCQIDEAHYQAFTYF